MSKQHKIKWRESDTKELNRAVKNFNAKLNRLAKTSNNIILPEKVKVSELKKLINTRQDLTREINMLKRFSKKGSEKAVVIEGNENNLIITKWQKTEMNRRVGIINRKRKERFELLQDLEVYSRGQSLGYKKGDIGMGRVAEHTLKPMNAFTKSMSKGDLRAKWKAIMKESPSDFFTETDYRLKQNYIDTMLRNYNEEDVKDIIEVINNMDIKDFIVKFEQEQDVFDWNYPDEEKYTQYLSTLKSIWTPNKGNEDITMKSNSETLFRYNDKVNIYGKEDLSMLKGVTVENGYIALYQNGNKIGRFSSGEYAYEYIRKRNLVNGLSFNLEK